MIINYYENEVCIVVFDFLLTNQYQLGTVPA